MTATDIYLTFFPSLSSTLISHIILQQRNNFYSARSVPHSLTLTDGLNWSWILLGLAQAFLYLLEAKIVKSTSSLIIFYPNLCKFHEFQELFPFMLK